jgi:hypothetical protein
MSWEIEEDFSDTTPAVTRLGQSPPVSMPFEVTVDETEMRETRAGNKRVAMYMVATGPTGFEGYEFMDGLNVPEGPHADLQRRFWVTTLISLGHNASKLKKKLKISPSTIEGKTGYVYFTTKEDAGSEYYDVKWLTKKQYDKLISRLTESGELANMQKQVALKQREAAEATTEVDDFNLPDEESEEIEIEEPVKKPAPKKKVAKKKAPEPEPEPEEDEPEEDEDEDEDEDPLDVLDI